jgi:soluble lytic murein transglycosylase-like protein
MGRTILQLALRADAAALRSAKPTCTIASCLLVLAACAGPDPAAPALVSPEPAPASGVAGAAAAPPTAAAPVTSAAATPKPAPANDPPPLALDDEQLARARRVQKHVIAASKEYGVEPNLINAIIWNESKFNPKARNRSGARGLMQLMPKTSRAMAKRIGRANRPYDPSFSIHAGTYLISRLLEKFDGDVELALFGYARGSGNVRKWQSAPPQAMPEGVQEFIARVRRAQATFEGLGFPSPPLRTAKMLRQCTDYDASCSRASARM